MLRDAARLFDVSASAGFSLWLLITGAIAVYPSVFDSATTPTAAVLLAALVVVPLSARLADLPFRDGGRSLWYKAASILVLPAGLCVSASLAAPKGPVGGVLAAPWLVVTVLLAVFGAQRGLPNTVRPSELGVSVGLLYLPVAGIALVAHRLGVTGGFTETTVLLTVVHFSYAGCALPVFVGLVGRGSGTGSVYRLLIAPVLVGPGIIGLGIAFSPTVELVSAAVFAVVIAGVAVYTVLNVSVLAGVGNALIGTAAVSVAASMGLVVAYLWTELPYGSPVTVGFGAMVLGHGLLNAVGFGLVGLVGWRVLDPPTDAPPLGMPVSRLVSRGRVGADYLERKGVEEGGRKSGMVDDFTVFNVGEGKGVHPEIRRFYEETEEYDLDVEPSWSRGFRLGGRVYGWFGRRLEQMNLPTGKEARRLRSRVVGVDGDADGRGNVSAWVRTYDGTKGDGNHQEAIYVAVYATHVLDGEAYMNIAFPLPLTNLTSILSVRSLNGHQGGVELSTTTGGDAGIYLRTPLGPLRLPMDETIRVHPPDTKGGRETDGVTATHDMFLFGSRFLRLDYLIEEEDRG